MKSRDAWSDYIYIIDNADRIVSVSDNWLLFAQENQASESCHPDMIINKTIWDFISGVETKHLYEVLLKKVREINRAVILPFRCDGPDKRRYLELIISPRQKESIEFTSYIILEESRDKVELLETGIPTSDDIIKMCSMCKKVELAEDSWVEVEIAVATLKLFEQHEPPRISHGLCTQCFESGMSEINKLIMNANNEKH